MRCHSRRLKINWLVSQMVAKEVIQLTKHKPSRTASTIPAVKDEQLS